MSQRTTMIMALALTLLLGTGVYAARGRVTALHTAQSTDQAIVATEVVTLPVDVISRQNPAPVSTTDALPSAEVTIASGESEEDDNDDVNVVKSSSSTSSTVALKKTKTVNAEKKEYEDD